MLSWLFETAVCTNLSVFDKREQEAGFHPVELVHKIWESITKEHQLLLHPRHVLESIIRHHVNAGVP